MRNTGYRLSLREPLLDALLEPGRTTVPGPADPGRVAPHGLQRGREPARAALHLRRRRRRSSSRTGSRLLAMTRPWCPECRASCLLRARSRYNVYASANSLSTMTHGLAIIGNCSYNALLKEGSVEWLCWPRPDSSFVFGPLLDREQGGAFTSRASTRSRSSSRTSRTRTCCARCSAAKAAPSSSSTSRRASSSTTASSSRRCSSGSCGRSPESRARACAAARPTSTASRRSGAGARRTTSSSRASRHRCGSRRTCR